MLRAVFFHVFNEIILHVFSQKQIQNKINEVNVLQTEVNNAVIMCCPSINLHIHVYTIVFV